MRGVLSCLLYTSFDHVWFGYEKDKPVLRDVSFTAKAGETIAILGATGSGKSSLVHLLQRLYDYDKGEITLGGRPIRQLNRKWLRHRVGIVLQEPFLFSKTIRENIGITKRGAGEDEIIEAARIAAVHEAVSYTHLDVYKRQAKDRALGIRIRELRRRQGLTQRALCEALELKASTLSQYESGQRTPNDAIKARICLLYTS